MRKPLVDALSGQSLRSQRLELAVERALLDPPRARGLALEDRVRALLEMPVGDDPE